MGFGFVEVNNHLNKRNRVEISQDSKVNWKFKN
jgi:hypothetical protein